MQVEFFFDYVSPYAYLAWQKVMQLQKARPKLEFKFTPILFAALLNHWGHKGPAEIPSKRDYVFRHCLNLAKRLNVSFTLPQYHPFVPLLPLRLSLYELVEEKQTQMINLLWQAGWQEGIDLSSAEQIGEMLVQNDLPLSFIDATQNIKIKTILHQNTQHAIENGVFGVPTFLTADGVLFWGYDSIEDLLDYVEGNPRVDPKHAQQLLMRESKAQRLK